MWRILLDVLTVLAAVFGAVAITGGLILAGRQSLAAFRAVHELAERIASPPHADALGRLQNVRSALTSKPPDRAAVDEAAGVVREVADGLTKDERRAALGALSRGTRANVAAYVVEVADEAAKLAGS